MTSVGRKGFSYKAQKVDISLKVNSCQIFGYGPIMRYQFIYTNSYENCYAMILKGIMVSKMVLRV